MKKIVSVILVMIMALSAVSMTALATDLTIKEPTDMAQAAYAGYMILNATNNADNQDLFAYTLNPKYTAIVQNVTGKTNQADIVKYIAGLTDDGMRSFANDVYAAIKTAGLGEDKALETGKNAVREGYWLIAQTSPAPAGETQSLVMVNTAGKAELTIESKKESIPVRKLVSDESQLICGNKQHQHTASCYNWTKTNESPIGATEWFKIDTTVPATMSGYKYDAYFIVGDTLSQGLTLNADSITVTIDGEAAMAGVDYTVRFADGQPACADGYTFQVALVNPKDCAGKDVVVVYNAMLNGEAKLSLTGNPNEADVTFTNDSNTDYGGRSDGGFPSEETVPVDGKTPKDFTITYGTGIRFVKLDGDTKKALNGAEFTVTGTTESTKLVWKQEYTKAAAGGTHYLLKDGSYTTKAPVPADYMTESAAQTFKGGYVVVSGSEQADVTVDNTGYRAATQADFDAGKTIFTLVKSNAGKYAETTPNYTYSEGWEEQTATKAYNTVVKVNEDGIVNLPGLAAGTYTVSETKVPEGYNKIDDFTVTVTWTAPTRNELNTKGEDAQCVWTAKLDNGTKLSLTEVNELWNLFELTVINNAGAKLPSTGGIGTTIFYALGGVMVAAAAVVLVTRKRMGNKD